MSRTETIARLQPDGTYRLSGFKFFTSGANSDVTLALARIVDGGDEGSMATSRERTPRRKLSLFLVKLRDEEGKLNGIVVHKLKNKMGTKAMPTAELELIDTPAILVSEPERGVSAISPMLNISRVAVSFLSIGLMRRAIAICRDYSHRREVLGVPLAKQPLHLHTMASIDAEFRGCLLFALHISKYVGMSEAESPAASVEDLCRILCPLVKLYACKSAVGLISEAMECVGGSVRTHAASSLTGITTPGHIYSSLPIYVYRGTWKIRRFRCSWLMPRR